MGGAKKEPIAPKYEQRDQEVKVFYCELALGLLSLSLTVIIIFLKLETQLEFFFY